MEETMSEKDPLAVDGLAPRPEVMKEAWEEYERGNYSVAHEIITDCFDDMFATREKEREEWADDHYWTEDPSQQINVELPWPPSINNYYGCAKTGHIYIKPAGKIYRKTVCAILFQRDVGSFDDCDLSMTMHAYPPDNRRRDLDNIQKPLWDALEHGGAYHNDSQIKHFEAFMHPHEQPGRVVVRLRPKQNSGE
jgi:crossover junction endodeoxyribonuclease RusA